MWKVAQLYGDRDLMQLVLRGHGNQHALKLSPGFTLTEDTIPPFFYIGLWGLTLKLANTASIVLDGCLTGPQGAQARHRGPGAARRAVRPAEGPARDERTGSTASAALKEEHAPPAREIKMS